MRKNIFLPTFCVFLLFPTQVFAARDITISTDTSTLSGDEEMVVTTALSDFTDGELIYIKGAFYKEGSTNYFAYSKNDDNWIKNSETTTDQKQVKIGEWDGKISVKSDFSDSGFDGNGDYKFKIGFYYTTSGGNLSSVNWSSDTIDINLREPDPTPSPQPSSTPNPTSTPTPKPTSSSTAVSTKKSPSPTPLKNPTPTTPTSPGSSPQVLGQKDLAQGFAELGEADIVNSPSPSPSTYDSPFNKNVSKILIGTGILFILVSSGVYLWYKRSLGQEVTINKGNERFEEKEE